MEYLALHCLRVAVAASKKVPFGIAEVGFRQCKKYSEG